MKKRSLLLLLCCSLIGTLQNIYALPEEGDQFKTQCEPLLSSPALSMVKQLKEQMGCQHLRSWEFCNCIKSRVGDWQMDDNEFKTLQAKLMLALKITILDSWKDDYFLVDEMNQSRSSSCQFEDILTYAEGKCSTEYLNILRYEYLQDEWGHQDFLKEKKNFLLSERGKEKLAQTQTNFEESCLHLKDNFVKMAQSLPPKDSIIFDSELLKRARNAYLVAFANTPEERAEIYAWSDRFYCSQKLRKPTLKQSTTYDKINDLAKDAESKQQLYFQGKGESGAHPMTLYPPKSPSYQHMADHFLSPRYLASMPSPNTPASALRSSSVNSLIPHSSSVSGGAVGDTQKKSGTISPNTIQPQSISPSSVGRSTEPPISIPNRRDELPNQFRALTPQEVESEANVENLQRRINELEKKEKEARSLKQDSENSREKLENIRSELAHLKDELKAQREKEIRLPSGAVSSDPQNKAEEAIGVKSPAHTPDSERSDVFIATERDSDREESLYAPGDLPTKNLDLGPGNLFRLDSKNFTIVTEKEFNELQTRCRPLGKEQMEENDELLKCIFNLKGVAIGESLFLLTDQGRLIRYRPQPVVQEGVRGTETVLKFERKWVAMKKMIPPVEQNPEKKEKEKEESASYEDLVRKLRIAP